MKILLINPPYTRFKGMIDRYAPLGLCYLAAVLEKEGHKVVVYNAENPAIGEGKVIWDFEYRLDVFDLFLKRMDDTNDIIWQEIRNTIKETRPDVVGITCKTVTYKIAKKIAEISKELFSDMPVIFGGPHPSVASEEVIKYEYCDFVVGGEGEETIKDLIRHIETKEIPLKNIGGLLYKENGSVKINRRRDFIKNLDSIPFPSKYLLLNNHNYNRTILSNMMGGIIGSRGCPFECKFCSDMNVWGRNVRYRDPNKIIDEIEETKRLFGTIEFYFWDDAFTLNRKRVIDFCSLLVKRKTNIAWGCHTRADLIDDEVILNLKKAGCFKISMGIESGCEETLKNIKKQILLKDVIRASKILNKHRMDWNAAFIIGFPSEKEEQMMQTINFMKSIKPTRLFLSAFTPFPGTELYEETKNMGLINDSIDWSAIETKSPKNAFVTQISKERFQKLFRETMEWIDSYNNKSDTFFHRLNIRLPFYRKHPLLFVKRVIQYLQLKYYD
ncbi:MAG: radical SAM protein [Candidatus Hydrogenedentota bacterium]